jgi:hypothetical protein
MEPRVDLSPFFTAIVGGRGTGKSTFIHALRVAFDRSSELPAETDPHRQFNAFRQIAKGRTGTGGFTERTVLRAEWRDRENKVRLTWSSKGSEIVVEEQRNDSWVRSASQAVSSDRFPIRIFSQGQIATMASAGRPALLGIIDQSAGLQQHFDRHADAQRQFLSYRAKLRELDGQLSAVPEVDRKLNDTTAKIAAFTSSNHSTVQSDFARTQREHAGVKNIFENARSLAANLDSFSANVQLPTPQSLGDAGLRDWETAVTNSLDSFREKLRATSEELRGTIEAWKKHPEFKLWYDTYQAAKAANDLLLEKLSRDGVSDPNAFGRLVSERTSLEKQQIHLRDVAIHRADVARRADTELQNVDALRAQITSERKKFLTSVLRDNPHVGIELIAFGFDEVQIEYSLRRLLSITDGRFAEDILSKDENGNAIGIVARFLAAPDKEEALRAIRYSLAHDRSSLSGKLRAYLTREEATRPELIDRVLAWSPHDDLRIEYSRGGAWHPIEEGSEGQRSAALLAFLLAFGEEPIVLDQPEDDLDNQLIYDLIVTQIRANKLRRQLVIVTHNPNVVVNGDAEYVHVMDFGAGQCLVKTSGCLQEPAVRTEVCRVMEGGPEAFARRWKRLGG